MPRTRIIAVDDDRRILRLIKRACESVGYEVHCVLDAEFFESAFRVFEPALVFLDLHMKEIDGVQLLHFIAEERRDTTVVLTTGLDERVVSAVQALGVSLELRMLEPIRKPLIVADVRERLKSFQKRPTKSRRNSIEASELRRAVTEHHVEVCYQPMVDLATRRIVCAEALARIRRPDGSLLAPEQFIAVAEKSGLIEPLTFAVLREALTDLGGWQSPVPDMQVAVNLSPELLNDATLPERIGALLEETGVDPAHLVLDVAEGNAPKDRARVADTLTRLRLKGVHLALDDFGAGHSTLGQLYEFPYEMLKLDKKLAMRAEHSEEAASIIRSSLDLARSVGLMVVAEGIQSEDTLRWLSRIGCDVGQGFHIGPPMSAAGFSAWLLRLGRLGPPRDEVQRGPTAITH